MLKRIVIPVLLLAVGFGSMQLLTSFKKEQKRVPSRPAVRTVHTKKVYYSKQIPVIETMGRITPLEHVALTPEVSGIVQKKHFRLYKGTSFKKNEILFSIDSSQVYFGYCATISDLQNAVAALLPEFSETMPGALKRWQTFFGTLSTSSLPPLPGTTTDREKLLATRYSVYKLYYLAKQQYNTLSKHTLHAPFNGTVESSQISPSSMARAGNAVASIVRTDILEVEIALPLQQLAAVKNHGTVVITLPEQPNTSYTGTIHRTGTVVDDRMQTAAMFIRITDPPLSLFRPGAYAEVRCTGTPIGHAFSVPRKALNGDTSVYIINNGLLVKMPVTVAHLSSDSAYCTEGIPEGSALIIEPLQDAVPGMAVQDEETARKRSTNRATKKSSQEDAEGKPKTDKNGSKQAPSRSQQGEQ